ncbi:unnamed protein product [Eruca vesicaria subsp. sativa]|uniref:Uncharacterized protein n=1 Tax=Eruca vesicaria subsp. sativa TaxID=29727 RepID=A0ABC8KZF4_ERUVS|nr:unnamed protein product [Eruca vesicaria subsp. sativa]
MSSDSSAVTDGGEQVVSSAGTSAGPSPAYDKQKEKARVSRTSLILWHAHQNDAASGEEGFTLEIMIRGRLYTWHRFMGGCC